jgi:hypothetical protein
MASQSASAGSSPVGEALASQANRSNAIEMRAKKASELQALRDKNTSSMNEVTKTKHFQSIRAKEADLLKRDSKIAASNTPSIKTGVKASASRTKYTTEDCKRLIYARTLHNVSFSQHLQTAIQKTDMMATSYNYGFVLRKEFVSGATEDIHFLPLEVSQHKNGPSLLEKWNHLKSSFSFIVTSQQEESIDAHVAKSTYKTTSSGQKLSQDEIRLEVIANIEKERSNFKNYQDMIDCKWEDSNQLNPTQRISLSKSVLSVSDAGSAEGTPPGNVELLPLAGPSDPNTPASARLGGGKSSKATGNPSGRPRGSTNKAKEDGTTGSDLMKFLVRSQEDSTNMQKQIFELISGIMGKKKGRRGRHDSSSSESDDAKRRRRRRRHSRKSSSESDGNDDYVKKKPKRRLVSSFKDSCDSGGGGGGDGGGGPTSVSRGSGGGGGDGGGGPTSVSRGSGGGGGDGGGGDESGDGGDDDWESDGDGVMCGGGTETSESEPNSEDWADAAEAASQVW